MRDYHINVFWSVEDKTYIADIPDLKYCSAHGTTPQAALSQVLIAKEAWLEAARENEFRRVFKPQRRSSQFLCNGHGDTDCSLYSLHAQ